MQYLPCTQALQAEQAANAQLRATLELAANEQSALFDHMAAIQV